MDVEDFAPSEFSPFTTTSSGNDDIPGAWPLTLLAGVGKETATEEDENGCCCDTCVDIVAEEGDEIFTGF